MQGLSRRDLRQFMADIHAGLGLLTRIPVRVDVPAGGERDRAAARRGGRPRRRPEGAGEGHVARLCIGHRGPTLFEPAAHRDDPGDQQAVIHAARRFYVLYGDIFRALPVQEEALCD